MISDCSLANNHLNIQDFFIDDFDSYQDVYNAVVPFNNITEYNIGGRLIPRSLVEMDINTLMTTLKYIVAESAGVSGVSVNVSSFPLNVANSVNPVWRTSIYSFVLAQYVPRFIVSFLI